MKADTTKATKSETLAEDFLKEQVRVRELLSMYKESGPDGMFGASMIELQLDIADKAVASGDTAAMFSILERLKEIR